MAGASGPPPEASLPSTGDETSSPDPHPPDPREERFYAAALSRMLRSLLLVGIILTSLVLWKFGAFVAAGFAAGVFLSWLNFRSLAVSVEGLADRIVNRQSRERGTAIVGRFLLRYLLVGLIAYGILKGSLAAFRGFLWGLTLPVAAMLIEAAYEAFVAFGRRD